MVREKNIASLPPPQPVSPEQYRRAAVAVVTLEPDADAARLLLDMLGIRENL